jgi:HSP20 family protein
MSFLEKLQKGMQSAPPGPGSIPDEEIGATDMPQDEMPGQGDALLASYRAPALRSDAEDDMLLPAQPPVRKRPRGRPRKLITAQNVEEMTKPRQDLQIPGEAQETKETIKNLPSKTMTNKTAPETESANDKTWLDGEGQLAVNVYQTDNDLVLQAAIAGIKVEDIDVVIEDDVITIKGNRSNPLDEKGDYFIEECYWGPFSRKVILPVEVETSRADAAMKDGILTIRIPKIQREKKKRLTVKS